MLNDGNSIAGWVVLGSAVVHVFHGDLKVLRGCESGQDFPLLRLAWHAVAVLQAVIGILLLTHASSGFEVKVIAAAYLTIAVLGAAFTRGRHPVWLFYIGLATLVWLRW